MSMTKDNFLTGKCLISMPNMQDEGFNETLIYINLRDYERKTCSDINNIQIT